MSSASPKTNTKGETQFGFQGPPPPNDFNLTRYCLAYGISHTPDKPALVVLSDVKDDGPSEVWSYAQLEAAILNVAGALQARQIPLGARILIHLENTSSYAILFFGAIAAGLVPLPASAQLTPKELGFLIENATPSLIASSLAEKDLPASLGAELITPATLLDIIHNGPSGRYANTQENDPAYLIYTSGTTANPKGVLHAHRAAWGRRPMYQDWYGITPDDRMLHAGAFNWTYTLGTGLIDPWVNGATAYVCTGKREASDWPDILRKTRATLFAAVPGVFRQFLKYGNFNSQISDSKPFPDLRHGLTAGEAPPQSLFKAWQTATGTPLYEALGMSEISTYISTGPNTPRKPGTIGKAQRDRSIAILPEEAEEGVDPNQPLPPGTPGLLAVHRSDPGLMLGYWNRPDEEADVFRGDWFAGGDRAVIDDEGYISHLGRANDVMKALGYRVAPQEVESILAKHNDVAEVACAEVAVREDISVIGAFIVLRSGAQTNADALTAFAREHLAAYKVPREIVFVEQLPRTANGKVRRAALPSLFSPTL